VIYVYCICGPTTAQAPRGRGLGGARLRALYAGPLAAVYSRHRSFCVRPAADQVLRHERVIEEFMHAGPVLPLRVGTRFEREEQLADVLAQRENELSLSLDRVRGHVELGLRVIPRRPQPPPGAARPPSGRDTLLARVALHDHARQFKAQLHAPLAEVATASTVREFPRPPALLVSSYLVDDIQVDRFRRRAAQLAAGWDDVWILVTGPWPPYSFVEEGP
jgi:Gas vesicle synthesis protein GvpL/GvpF